MVVAAPVVVVALTMVVVEWEVVVVARMVVVGSSQPAANPAPTPIQTVITAADNAIASLLIESPLGNVYPPNTLEYRQIRVRVNRRWMLDSWTPRRT